MNPDPEDKATGRPRRAVDGAAGKAARDERLKAALKANMARRKAQARAKGAGAGGEANGAVRDGDDRTE